MNSLSRTLAIFGCTLLTSAIAWIISGPAQFNSNPLGTLLAIVAAALGVQPLVLASLWTKPLLRGAAITFTPPIAAAAALIALPVRANEFLVIAIVSAIACLLANVLLPDRGSAFRPSQCGQCGYELRGNQSGVCPECGGDITTMKLIRSSIRPLNLTDRFIAWAIASIVAAALTTILVSLAIGLFPRIIRN